MFKFKLKPDNTFIEISKTTGTVGDIVNNDILKTVALRKNGPPIGAHSDLVSTTPVVSGDILYIVPSPNFTLTHFAEQIIADINSLHNATATIQTASTQNAVITVQIQKEEACLLISKLGSTNKLNAILTIGESTENFQLALNLEGLKEASFKITSSISNYLRVPIAGILELPNSVLQCLFLQLSAYQLCQMAGVSKRMRVLAEDDDVWQGLFNKEFPAGSRDTSELWKHAYKREYLQKKRRQEYEAERRQAHLDPLREPSRVPRHPGFGLREPFPGIPGMIGGQHDLDPFAPMPANLPGLGGLAPRRDPIYGPDGLFQPGRGLGSDDDINTTPGFGPGRGRGRGGGAGLYGGPPNFGNFGQMPGRRGPGGGSAGFF